MSSPIGLGESFVGGELTFWYNSGTHDAPSWTQIRNRSDINMPDSTTVVAAPNTAQWPYIGSLLGGRTVGLSWTMDRKKGVNDTALVYLLNKYDAREDVEFAVADGDINEAGTNYDRIICKIAKKDEAGPIEGVVTYSFEAPFSANAQYLPSRATAS